jgi:hypothetical protein
LRGNRKLKIYENIERDLLYIDPLNPNFSLIKTNDVEIENKFPMFQKAKYFDVDLKEGEMLFLPFHWYYSSSSTEEYISLKYSYHSTSTGLKSINQVLGSFYWRDPYDLRSTLVEKRKLKNKKIIKIEEYK